VEGDQAREVTIGGGLGKVQVKSHQGA